jgi:hypothetical protein
MKKVLCWGSMVRAKSKLVFGAVAYLAIASCGDSSNEKEKKTRLSGPVGTQYSVHPKFEGVGRERIPGCCSFEPGAATVKKLEGDLDGREVVGKGYHATFSFGSGAISRSNVPKGSKTVIDSVELFRHADMKSATGGANITYAAIVPLSSEAEKRRIDPPELEIIASCEDRVSCAEMKKMLDTLRF